MLCIFCREERKATEEHTFPYAIGGCHTTDRVCKTCNALFGAHIDIALSKDFFVIFRRAKLGLAGQSGKIPTIHDELIGKATLADKPTQYVLTTFDVKAGKLNVKALPQISQSIEGKTISYQILVDINDKESLVKIINRLRKKHGEPPLSSVEVEDKIGEFSQNTYIEQPTLNLQKTYDFTFLPHAFIKIAYELAFLWLGEDYLADPLGNALRVAVLEYSPTSTSHLQVCVERPAQNDGFDWWPPSEGHHLAYAMNTHEGIFIGIRIFDCYTARVKVTGDPGRYLSTRSEFECLRFLDIDAQTRTFRESSLIEELIRISKSINDMYRLPTAS